MYLIPEFSYTLNIIYFEPIDRTHLFPHPCSEIPFTPVWAIYILKVELHAIKDCLLQILRFYLHSSSPYVYLDRWSSEILPKNVPWLIASWLASPRAADDMYWSASCTRWTFCCSWTSINPYVISFSMVMAGFAKVGGPSLEFTNFFPMFSTPMLVTQFLTSSSYTRALTAPKKSAPNAKTPWVKLFTYLQEEALLVDNEGPITLKLALAVYRSLILILTSFHPELKL